MAERFTPITLDAQLTTGEAARFLLCNQTSIINWTKQGKLACFVTPGGHRRILAADLVAFIKNHNMPMPSALAGVANV